MDIQEISHFFKGLDKEKAGLLQSLFTERGVKRNTLLLAEGQLCRESYVVKSGVARKYFHHGDREVTTEIYLKGDIAFSFESVNSKTGSPENIQAVTDLHVYCINHLEFDKARKQYDWLVPFELTFLEQYTIQLEHKLKEQAVLNAAERYKKMLVSYPHLIQEVPLKVIASYLNITAERLSRIRAGI